jgi:superoxide reductase
MKRLQIYKCALCGNIVMVLHASGGTLECCGQAMELLQENTVDAAKEKHVPVIEKIAGGFKVSVGSVPHPMEEKHYIQWIELVDSDGKVLIKFLNPGEKPEAEFESKAESATAREHCNLHGLWKS